MKYFLFKIPNHSFYESPSLIKAGEGYVENIPIQTVKFALNELIKYQNSIL